jgi:hypothetical protein
MLEFAEGVANAVMTGMLHMTGRPALDPRIWGPAARSRACALANLFR